MQKPPPIRLLKAEPSLTFLKERIEKEVYGGPVLLVHILQELWAVAFPDGKLIEGVQIRRVGHLFRFEESF